LDIGFLGRCRQADTRFEGYDLDTAGGLTQPQNMRSRPPFLRTAALLAAGALILAACTSDEKARPTADQPGGGGRLVVGVLMDEQGSTGCTFIFCGPVASDIQIAGLGPIQFEVGRCCLARTLLSYNGQPTGKGGGIVRPDLAAELPDVSPDGLTWTFKIKPGLHYAPPLEDGTIQSGDFVRSIERAMSARPEQLNPGFGDYLDSYTMGFLALVDLISGGTEYADGETEHVSGLSAPDPSTLVVHLTKPVGHLGSILSGSDLTPIPPNPSDPDARFGVADGLDPYYLGLMVSSGPYMIEGADEIDYSQSEGVPAPPTGEAADHLLLVRNPSWDPASDDLRVASPDEILIVPLESAKEGTELVKQGAMDVVINQDATPEQLGENAVGAGTQSFDATRDVMVFLSLNVAIPPEDDVHVRRAMNYATARGGLPKVWEKVGKISDVATHVGLDSEEENLLLNFDPYDAPEGNLSKAMEEMALSKYDSDHDGKCDGEHCELSILVREDQPEQIETAKVVGRQLKAIGLDIKVDVPSLDDFYATYGNPDMHTEIRLDQWVKDLSSGATYFPPLFASPRTGLVQQNNDVLLGATPKELKGWGYKVDSVPNVDDRVEACSSLTFSAQSQCWADLDSYLMTQVAPWVPLLKLKTGRVTSARVTSFSFDQSPQFPLPALDRIAIDPSIEAKQLPKPRPFPDIPEGVYQVTITKGDFARLSPHTDNEGVQENTGTTKIVIRDGTFATISSAHHILEAPVTTGEYRGSDNHVVFEALRPFANKLVTPSMRWSLDGEELHLKFEDCGNLNKLEPHLCDSIKVLYEAHPWVKIG
jgi:peptide/nickel transport system substrate-binding protein